MSAAWEFNAANPSDVRIEVTQRDQFNNDDVALSDALVREAIQNSSDAPAGAAPVKVRFALKTLDGSMRQRLRECVAPLEMHFEACGLDKSVLDASEVRVLTIEDFNTTGLTGCFDELDKDNFDNFWRAIGDSEKKNQKGGRWGLGKLVYPSSSRARLFFGLTMRVGDPGPVALGQVVLSNHRIGEGYFRAHGFWFNGRSDNSLGLQMPTSEPADLEFLRSIADIARSAESGLSVIIPYLIPTVSERSLIEGVLTNYYFPILSGRVSVEVGNTLIDRDTFLEVAEEVGVASHRTPFDFILEVSERLGSGNPFSTSTPVTTARLVDQTLPTETIEEMKALFAGGGMVHFRAPVELSPRHGPKKLGHIDLFLQALPDGQSPYSLFARGPITLPGERHFSGVARGAMIAHDDDVAALLGDAENPAHTAWNANAEKLDERWNDGKSVLSVVRHSLRELYGLVAEHSETEDEDALIDFFSIVDKVEKAAGKKKRTVQPKPEVPPREAGIRIRAKEGGFEIKAGPAAANWDFPRVIRIRVAYDMIGANPFKKFSRFDFDLGKDKEITLGTVSSDHEIVAPNTIKLVASGPDFALTVEGFDGRRDLVVDARAL